MVVGRGCRAGFLSRVVEHINRFRRNKGRSYAAGFYKNESIAMNVLEPEIVVVLERLHYPPEVNLVCPWGTSPRQIYPYFQRFIAARRCSERAACYFLVTVSHRLDAGSGSARAYGEQANAYHHGGCYVFRCVRRVRRVIACRAAHCARLHQTINDIDLAIVEFKIEFDIRISRNKINQDREKHPSKPGICHRVVRREFRHGLSLFAGVRRSDRKNGHGGNQTE